MSAQVQALLANSVEVASADKDGEMRLETGPRTPPGEGCHTQKLCPPPPPPDAQQPLWATKAAWRPVLSSALQRWGWKGCSRPCVVALHARDSALISAPRPSLSDLSPWLCCCVCRAHAGYFHFKEQSDKNLHICRAPSSAPCSRAAPSRESLVKHCTYK